MFNCAWCKNETKEIVWTDDKEPICSDKCFNKYQFGKSEGLITGGVSDLSAAQRRQISERLHILLRLKGTVRAVEREELRGIYKKAETIGNTAIFLVVLGSIVFCLQGLIVYKVSFLQRAEYIGFHFLLYMGLLFFAGIIIMYLQKRLAWYLRFKQMTREAGIRRL